MLHGSPIDCGVQCYCSTREDTWVGLPSGLRAVEGLARSVSARTSCLALRTHMSSADFEPLALFTLYVTSFQRAPFNFPVSETLALWVRATAQDCSIPQDPQPSLFFIFFTKTSSKGTTRAVDIANVHGVGMDGQYIHKLKTQIRKLRYYKTLQPIL
jgi:hypothetical protein